MSRTNPTPCILLDNVVCTGEVRCQHCPGTPKVSRKRIAVVGGAGFVGSHIVDQYYDDHDILVIDDLSTGYLENLKQASRVSVLQENINSPVAQAALRTFKPHIIAHLAAQLEISRGYEDPVGEVEADLVTTVRLLEVCKRLGSVEHFVFASSACVFTPNGSRHLEPQWTYGAAKLGAEHYVRIYNKYFRTDSMRYGIVFGPREWYGRALTNFASRALKNEPLILFGGGQARRDFSYVADAARAHRLLTDNPGKYDLHRRAPFDIGSGRQLSIAGLAGLVAGRTDAKIIHEKVQEGAISKEMPGRLRLPDEMGSMHLLPHKYLKTRSVMDEGLLQEYLEYAKSNPIQWKSGRYRI